VVIVPRSFFGALSGLIEELVMQIVIASGNEGKVRELTRLFEEPRISLVSMKSLVAPDYEVEETGHTFEENAWLKALCVCRLLGVPVIADDSGLEVDALQGRPGVHSARYGGLGATDEENNQLLLREMENISPPERGARFRCVLVLAVPCAGAGGQGGEPVRVARASGAVEGTILTAPQGTQGFGYDPLFCPQESPERTMAEMSPAQKNALSHRAIAAQALQPQLQAWLKNM